MSWWAKYGLPEAWAAREEAARRERRGLKFKDEVEYSLPASEEEIRAMDEGNVPNVQDNNEEERN